jgi:hypothetical protein
MFRLCEKELSTMIDDEDLLEEWVAERELEVREIAKVEL